MKQAKKAAPGDPLVSIGCKIPKSLKAKVHAIAKSEDRVFQRVVGRALQEFVDNRTAKVPA